jgi:probable rRNA maturation factor
MIVNVSNEQTSLKIDSHQVETLVEQVLLSEGEGCDEVNLYFVDTPAICDLHKEYFDDPSTTDCISFPMDDDDDVIPYRILGEVFVCPETALTYSKQNAKDPLEETSLYIVHGLLHLMGYDDIEEADEVEMRAAEKRNMDVLRKQGKLLK